MDTQFRSDRLPPYVFTLVDELKDKAIAKGLDIIDFGMGNPDGATPDPIVQELIRYAGKPECHRYGASVGLPQLRTALAEWYQRKYQVKLDPGQEIVVTHGAKEGLAHLAWALTQPQDKVWVQNPCYPIHAYGFTLADAQVEAIPLLSAVDFIKQLKLKLAANQKPKILMLNFPSNPTGISVDQSFFDEIVQLAKHHQFWVIHDFPYAELGFEGYQPPSILASNGAKDVAVEVYSMSKSYHMPGWRVGFVSGNATLIKALKRLKSYVDYGMFAPVQFAAAKALLSLDDEVRAIASEYQKRRDCLVAGLNDLGWQTNLPKATMFVWAPVPEFCSSMTSLEFAQWLLIETGLVVAPGIGFGNHGENHVRFALIENIDGIELALGRIRGLFKSWEGYSIGSG